MHKRKVWAKCWTLFNILMPIMAMILIFGAAFLPTMGAGVLKYKIVKSIGRILLGIWLLVTTGHSLMKKEQTNTYIGSNRESLAQMYENGSGVTDIKSIVIVVLGVILLFIGGFDMVHSIKDMKSGPVKIILESTRVGKDAREEEEAHRSFYDIYGLANQELFQFRLNGDDMDELLKRKINYRSPQITVVYYPATKAIIQMQIYFEENDKVILPYGDRAYDAHSLEKLPEGKGEVLEDPEGYKKQ